MDRRDMSATALLAELAAHSVTIERHGNRLRMRAPQAPPADLIERVRDDKPKLLALLPDRDLRPVLYFALPSSAPGTVATALGRPGQTQADLAVSLRERWPSVRILPRRER